MKIFRKEIEISEFKNKILILLIIIKEFPELSETEKN